VNVPKNGCRYKKTCNYDRRIKVGEDFSISQSTLVETTIDDPGLRHSIVLCTTNNK
jgi:hypothetical protein